MRFQPVSGWWLITILAVAGLGFIGWQMYQLWHDETHRKQNTTALLAWSRKGGLLVLLTLLVLGPSVPGGVTSPGVANLDVLFVVDTTASMGAQDYAGTQLRETGLRNDVQALGEKLKGAHFSIITFASSADPILPFTENAATFSEAAKSLTREIYNTSNGSAIDRPLDLMIRQLRNSKAAYPERSRLVFFLSDGEQTIKDPIKTFEAVAKYVDGGAVLGYGTAKGAKMIKYSGLGGSEKPSYIMTPDPVAKKLVPAISKLDENALKKIASEMHVNYRNRNQSGSIDSVYKASNAPLLVDRGKHLVHYLNLYWLFAIPFAGLLFWEWNIILMQALALRESKGGRHA